MPNHVTNVIRFTGDRILIPKMLNEIKSDEYGVGTIDFNKLLPMPPSLDIEAGSRTDKGLEVYKDFIDVYTLMGTLEKDLLDIPEESEKKFLEMRKDVDAETWRLGKAAFQNHQRYGASTWYDWCWDNWGTKWNAYGYDEGYDYSDNDSLCFQTAWNAPHPVIAKLAERYPDLKIEHCWADEDIGSNCGRYCYEGGERTEEYYPESNVDCIEFATSVMDVNPSDWGLYKNASGSNYIYLSEDQYPLAEFLGRQVLFSEDRITDHDIPEGLTCYHFRSADGDDHPCAVEPVVSVNFAGSIITDEPINFGAEGYLAITEETAPVILDTTCTMEEYMNKSIGQHLAEDSAESQTM